MTFIRVQDIQIVTVVIAVPVGTAVTAMTVVTEVTRLNNSRCYITKKLNNSDCDKTQIVTKLQNSKNSNYDQTQKKVKWQKISKIKKYTKNSAYGRH